MQLSYYPQLLLEGDHLHFQAIQLTLSLILLLLCFAVVFRASFKQEVKVGVTLDSFVAYNLPVFYKPFIVSTKVAVRSLP